MTKGPLRLDDGTDYILRDGANSLWITVGNISVYVKRADDGVAVDLYPLNVEMVTPLASCWATYSEAEDEAQKEAANA